MSRRNVVRACDLVREHIPKFNPIIANGIVVEQFKELESYFIKIIRETAESFPESLKFIGFRRCLPDEEARFILEASKSATRTVEIAETSIYLCMVEFEYEGERIAQPVYLPYCLKGGQLYIRGVLNTIIPVLTAPVFSVEVVAQQIFMKMLSAKLIFKRLNYTILEDGKEITLGLVWSQVYRGDPKSMPHWHNKKDESVRIKHVTALYLFSEYGFEESVKRYTNTEIEVYHGDPNLSEEDKSRYTIFKSRDRKPTTVRGRAWLPHDIHIMVPKEKANHNGVLALIGAFFYIADSYSHFMGKKEDFKDPSFWQVILGKAIFLTKDSIGVLLAQIGRHMASVRRILDTIQIQDMEKSGIYCHSTIDLFAYVIENFTNILYEDDKGSLYKKKLLVLRNVLEELIKGINNIQFKVSSEKELRKQSVKSEISKNLTAERILKLRKKTKFCLPVSSPSDNVMFQHTCKFLLQNNISENNSDSKIDTDDPDNHLHASVLEIGSYLAAKKTEVTGRALLNPYQATTVGGITIQNPELEEKIAYIHDAIRRY